MSTITVCIPSSRIRGRLDSPKKFISNFSFCLNSSAFISFSRRFFSFSTSFSVINRPLLKANASSTVGISLSHSRTCTGLCDLFDYVILPFFWILILFELTGIRFFARVIFSFFFHVYRLEYDCIALSLILWIPDVGMILNIYRFIQRVWKCIVLCALSFVISCWLNYWIGFS